MIRAALLPALILATTPATAEVPARDAANAAARLSRITAGRTAGKPVECIQLDSTAQPEIIDGQGIVYRYFSTAYLARFASQCPLLRQGRTIITFPLNGELCSGTPARIVDSGMQLGQCVFAGFTPYTKAK